MKSRPSVKKVIAKTIISFVILLAIYIYMIDAYVNKIYGPNRNQEGMSSDGLVLLLMTIIFFGFVFWNIGLSFSHIIYSIIDLRKASKENNNKKVPLILLISNVFLLLLDIGFILMLEFNKEIFG